MATCADSLTQLEENDAEFSLRGKFGMRKVFDNAVIERRRPSRAASRRRRRITTIPTGIPMESSARTIA